MKLDQEGYFCAGLASSFAEVDAEIPLCGMDPESAEASSAESRPPIACKVFRVSRQPFGEVFPVEVASNMSSDRDQVLVLKYTGKFYAVDQQCPHSSAPLSDGILFDIEEFGLPLSCGITCPKHMWSFDLTTGLADRGNYRLKTWQVQLRPPRHQSRTPIELDDALISKGQNDQEVWIRRRPRIG